MKYTFLLFIAFPLHSYSQTCDPLKKVPNPFSFHPKATNQFQPNFDFKFKPETTTLFSVYNRDTKLNDTYYFSKEAAVYTKSLNNNNGTFSQKDSFNPYGASNIGLGVLMGTLETVISTVFK